MPPISSKDTRAWRILVIAAALFLGLTFWPAVIGRGYIYGDLGTLHIPFRTFIHQQMSKGIFPLWTPDSFGGLYLHGEGQAGLFHPFHLITYPLLNPQFQIQLEMTASYVILLAGCFFLFRRWSVSRSAALLGGLVFTFAGFSRMHLPHPNLMAVLAHIPWMLYCLDRLYRDDNGHWRWVLSIALLNGSAMLFGYPPVWVFGLIFQAWYMLWFFNRPAWRRHTLQVAAALLCGVLLGAPQWLSTLSSVSGSVRDNASPEFLLGGSWMPRNVVGFANPGLFLHGYVGDELNDEMDVYPGAGVLLLVSFIVLNPALRSKNSRAFWMLAILIVFGGLLSLGRYGRIYEIILRIPLVGGFRVPVRYFLFVQFGLAGLSALALDSFLDARSRLNRRWLLSAPAIAMGAVALLTCGIAWAKAKAAPNAQFIHFLKDMWAASFSDWRRILIGAAVVLIICTCYLFALRWNGRWTKVMVAIILGDLMLYAGSVWLAYPTGTVRDVIAELPDPGVSAPAVLSPPEESDPPRRAGKRKLYFEIWLSNVYALAGYRTTNGYAGLTPRGVLPMGSEPYRVLMGTNAISDGVENWRTVGDPLPPVRLVSDLVLSKRPGEDISRIDYRRQVLVAEPHQVDAAAHGTALGTDVSSQQKKVFTDTSGAMLCVLAQRYHPGWKASADGHPVNLFPVDGDLTGFVVPAGHHVTSLRFAPPDVPRGLWLAALGLLLVSVLTAITARSSRTPPGHHI